MRNTLLAFEANTDDLYDVWATIPIVEAEPSIGEVFRVETNKRCGTAEVVGYAAGESSRDTIWIMLMNYCHEKPEKPENPCNREFMEGISNVLA